MSSLRTGIGNMLHLILVINIGTHIIVIRLTRDVGGWFEARARLVARVNTDASLSMWLGWVHLLLHFSEILRQVLSELTSRLLQNITLGDLDLFGRTRVLSNISRLLLFGGRVNYSDLLTNLYGSLSHSESHVG